MLRRIRRSSTLALLLSPVGILFLAATRLLIVSDYNLNTALAILSSGGYVNTLLGTIIPLVPVIMPYLALLLLYLNRVVTSLLAFLVTALISPSALTRSGLLSVARHDLHMITVGTAGLAGGGHYRAGDTFHPDVVGRATGVRLAIDYQRCSNGGGNSPPTAHSSAVPSPGEQELDRKLLYKSGQPALASS